jgi:transcriptional regulator with XRE-family HTH domain
MNKLKDWILKELEKRDWSQADLARHAGVSRAAISDIVSGKRGLGRDLAVAISEALDTPLEEVYRAAGLLPPKPEGDTLTEEGLHILIKLDEHEKQDAIRFLRMRLDVQEERGKYEAKKKRTATTG